MTYRNCLVRYHGSIVDYHGRFRVVDTCDDGCDRIWLNGQPYTELIGLDDDRYVLAPEPDNPLHDSGRCLKHVRRESFTFIADDGTEIPDPATRKARS